jgi:ribokinase
VGGADRQPPKVCVIGSFAVGLSLRAERWPAAGETVLGRDFDQGPGGKGSNQAVQVARLGGAVELVACVGRDVFGDSAFELYKAEGVGTTYLRRASQSNTGVGLIVLDPQGSNRIVLDPGANSLLGPGDVESARQALIESSVVMTQLEIPLDAAAAAVRVGRAVGARTLLNPAPARALERDVLEAVDVLTPNQTEARLLAGLAPEDPGSDADVARRLLDLGAGAVVMTRGPEGALVVDPGGMLAVPSHDVEVVDSTGAGDAFNGALAVALAEGDDLAAAASRAVAAGALACTKLGVIPSLPTRAELDAFLDGGAQL